jgi:hypothetical protein
MTNMTKTYRCFFDLKAKSRHEADSITKSLAEHSLLDELRIQEDPLTDEEEGTILEIARIAIDDTDRNLYGYIADKLDLNDKELKKLLKKISKITNRP